MRPHRAPLAVTLLLVLVAFATSPIAASADVITTKDSRKIEGEIVAETAETVTIKMKLGTLTLERKDILSVERRVLPRAEYGLRRRNLDAKDADGRVELARFCIDKRLIEEAAELLVEAVKLKPAHRKARAALDDLDYHELPDGRWLPPDEFYPLIGYLRRAGRWVSPAEADLMDANAVKRDLKKEETVLVRRKRRLPEEVSEAESALRKAERRLADAEQKIATADDLIEQIKAQIPGLQTDVRVAERRAIDAANFLRIAEATIPPPNEDETSRAIRLSRIEEARLIAISADNDFRLARNALRQAQDDLNELAEFKARGPQVVAERTAAVEAAGVALDEVKAKEASIEGDLEAIRGKVIEIDAQIRILKDAKRRADAEEKLEKRLRDEGYVPKSAEPERRDPGVPSPD